MKKLIIRVILPLLLVLLTLPVFAQKTWLYTKDKKTYYRTFAVKDAKRLFIDNQSGYVRINTWKRSDISVRITVTAHTSSDGKAQTLLDEVSINEPSSRGPDLRYKTVFSKPMQGANTELTVDYVIDMPANNALLLTNKYGDISLDDLSGSLGIDLSYGSLHMGHIQGPNKNIKVAFGSADMAYIEAGNIDVSFSNLNIEKAKSIYVTNKFGIFSITNVDELTVNQHYGSVDIGSVGRLSATIDYAGVNIEHLLQRTDMTLKYCGSVHLESIAPTVDHIYLEASYGSVYCKFEEGTNLGITVKNQYSTWKNNLSSKVADNIEVVNNDKTDNDNVHIIKLKTGNGGGSANIGIKYGTLVFR